MGQSGFDYCIDVFGTLLNEFWLDFSRVLLDLPTMVLAHGLLNALFVPPCCAFAIMFEMSKKNSCEIR
jgi:hypothetical protein